jgi:putative heme iron utilization protein
MRDTWWNRSYSTDRVTVGFGAACEVAQQELKVLVHVILVSIHN